MPTAVQVPGLAVVSVGGSVFGRTRNGIHYSEEPFYNDVHGDAHGGDQGPPIDRQYLGIIARVRLQMTDWDKAVFSTILANVAGGAAGTVLASNIGALYIGGSKFLTLSWTCALDASFNRSFDIAIPTTEPKEVNVGTLNAECLVNFECWRRASDGRIWA